MKFFDFVSKVVFGPISFTTSHFEEDFMKNSLLGATATFRSFRSIVQEVKIIIIFSFFLFQIFFQVLDTL
jgi:hypothetical protein